MEDSAEARRPDSRIDKDDGRKYWSSIDADDNGMLGGYPQVSREDLIGSRAFLAKLGIGLRNGRRRMGRTLEGGAGVDLIEPIAKFTDTLRDVPGVGSIFNVGLEEWAPEEGAQYDLVWTQWCVGHLTDGQLVEYLRLCATVLEPKRGLIVLKENLISGGIDEFDDVDSSVTRQDSTFLAIFKQAGMRVVKMDVQRRLNTQDANVALLPVKMYALRPHATPASVLES